MIFSVSIQEYARLAHLFRKALDESYADSKLKNYPIFSLFPQGTCGDCSCLLSRFIVEHNVANGEYDYYNAYLEEVYQSWQRLFRAAHHPDRLRGYYPDGRNHDRGTDRDHIGHRAGLCSERGVSGHRPDERPHVRGFPGAETRPERHQLVRKCDERCHFPEMAFPLMLVSWYSVLGRRHLLKNFFRETIFLPLQQSKLV